MVFSQKVSKNIWCKTHELSVSLSNEHTEYCWVKPLKVLDISTHKDITINIVRFIEEKQKLGYKIECILSHWSDSWLI